MLRDIDDLTDDGGDDGEDENDGDEVDLFFICNEPCCLRMDNGQTLPNQNVL